MFPSILNRIAGVTYRSDLRNICGSVGIFNYGGTSSSCMTFTVSENGRDEFLDVDNDYVTIRYSGNVSPYKDDSEGIQATYEALGCGGERALYSPGPSGPHYIHIPICQLTIVDANTQSEK